MDNLFVAGDGRCDSPGHSASFCTYTLMDTSNNFILECNVVKVTESKISYHMEKDGLLRCLNEMQVCRAFVIFSCSTISDFMHVFSKM